MIAGLQIQARQHNLCGEVAGIDRQRLAQTLARASFITGRYLGPGQQQLILHRRLFLDQLLETAHGAAGLARGARETEEPGGAPALGGVEAELGRVQAEPPCLRLGSAVVAPSLLLSSVSSASVHTTRLTRAARSASSIVLRSVISAATAVFHLNSTISASTLAIAW